jgi:hypothetical protein
VTVTLPTGTLDETRERRGVGRFVAFTGEGQGPQVTDEERQRSTLKIDGRHPQLSRLPAGTHVKAMSSTAPAFSRYHSHRFRPGTRRTWPSIAIDVAGSAPCSSGTSASTSPRKGSWSDRSSIRKTRLTSCDAREFGRTPANRASFT